MTKYVGIADFGDEMTATVSIDDIDGYSWRGNIQSGEGHHALEIGAVRVVLRDGEQAGKWADAELGLDAVRRSALLRRAPVQARRPRKLTSMA